MVRFLLRIAVFLASAAIGLLVAGLVIPGMSVRPLGFVLAVVTFAVAQAVLAPFFAQMASRYASALLGGIGLVSTLAALILASVLTNGLTIRGLGSWVGATVVVWLVTALATVLLPKLLLKAKVMGSS
jgi:Mycobacterial 4 TMS phage holin, superfamily IV